MSYKVEKVWESNGFKCVVIMGSMGHRCGYVGVHSGHILYRQESNKDCPALLSYLKKLIDNNEEVGKRGVIPLFCYTEGEAKPNVVFNVHGGLTYSGEDPKYPVESSDIWWFGYDCGHAGDGIDLSVLKLEVRKIYAGMDGVVRRLDYCVEECENLAKQFKEVENVDCG